MPLGWSKHRDAANTGEIIEMGVTVGGQDGAVGCDGGRGDY